MPLGAAANQVLQGSLTQIQQERPKWLGHAVGRGDSASIKKISKLKSENSTGTNEKGTNDTVEIDRGGSIEAERRAPVRNSNPTK